MKLKFKGKVRSFTDLELEDVCPNCGTRNTEALKKNQGIEFLYITFIRNNENCGNYFDVAHINN